MADPEIKTEVDACVSTLAPGSGATITQRRRARKTLARMDTERRLRRAARSIFSDQMKIHDRFICDYRLRHQSTPVPFVTVFELERRARYVLSRCSEHHHHAAAAVAVTTAFARFFTRAAHTAAHLSDVLTAIPIHMRLRTIKEAAGDNDDDDAVALMQSAMQADSKEFALVSSTIDAYPSYGVTPMAMLVTVVPPVDAMMSIRADLPRVLLRTDALGPDDDAEGAHGDDDVAPNCMVLCSMRSVDAVGHTARMCMEHAHAALGSYPRVFVTACDENMCDPPKVDALRRVFARFESRGSEGEYARIERARSELAKQRRGELARRATGEADVFGLGGLFGGD